MNAGGRGGGAKGDVNTPKPARLRVGDSDCTIDAGRLELRSNVSTSALVKLDMLRVWLYADIPLSGTSFSVAVWSSENLRESGDVASESGAAL